MGRHMRKEVMIAGISYRESTLRSNLDSMQKHFEELFLQIGLNSQKVNFLWQPENDRINLSSRFSYFKTWMYSYHLFFMSSNKNLKLPRALTANLYFMVRKILHRDAESSGRSTARYMYLDQVLTAKHLEAINKFLDTSSDYLLIVCDDVMVADNISLDAKTLLKVISSYEGRGGVFIEFAPYYSLKQLEKQFNYRVFNDSMQGWFKADFFANTAACYLINRNTAEQISQAVFENPKFRLVSIDWMLTYLARSLKNEIDYWVLFPQPYFNSSLYTGLGGLVGEQFSSLVVKKEP
jgi:hypothetical protein